jgi:hypothetical protein
VLGAATNSSVYLTRHALLFPSVTGSSHGSDDKIMMLGVVTISAPKSTTEYTLFDVMAVLRFARSVANVIR